MRGPDGKDIAIGLRNGNLYKINFKKLNETNATDVVQSWRKDGALELRHSRLEHLKVKYVHALQSIVNSINPSKISSLASSSICEACIEGQQL